MPYEHAPLAHMVHVRAIVPPDRADNVVALLCGADGAINVVHLAGAAHRPDGDLVLADVTRETVSVIVGDLRELDVDIDGSITLEPIETTISTRAVEAEKRVAGMPTDAVVWEDVEAKTFDDVAISAVYLLFMVLAMQVALVGIIANSPVLIVGSMILGPEYGALAAFSVSTIEKRWKLSRQALAALAVGFPVGIAGSFLTGLALDALDQIPEDFTSSSNSMVSFITEPNFLAFFVAFVAGVAGILVLTSAKSGALVGVLVSVTTIPAAADVGLGIAVGDFHGAGLAALQLVINLGGLLLAGVITVFIQRRLYVRRRRLHLAERSRRDAGLPEGRSRRDREHKAEADREFERSERDGTDSGTGPGG